MDASLDLSRYLADSNRALVRTAMRAAVRHPREFLFLLRTSRIQRRATRIRATFAAQGRHVPSFLIASITDRCNLYCTGCYARANRACHESRQDAALSTDRWGELFREARSLGIGFVLLAGGEPLLRPDVLERAALETDVVFPVFTNGTLLDPHSIRLFDHHRNLVPILSLEGDREETDARRGSGTDGLLVASMEAFRRKGILFGASITVTTRNLAVVSSDRFIRDLLSRGCGVVLFIEYVPVAPDSVPLAPGDAERGLLEGRLEALRSEHRGVPFLSFPGDERYLDGCLAAGRGFFHINPEGGAEPCPFSPYSDTSLKSASLLDALDSPLFRRLERDGVLRGDHAGGCLLFERTEQVREILREPEA